jgi:hypothetical protein
MEDWHGRQDMDLRKIGTDLKLEIYRLETGKRA